MLSEISQRKRNIVLSNLCVESLKKQKPKFIYGEKRLVIARVEGRLVEVGAGGQKYKLPGVQKRTPLWL